MLRLNLRFLSFLLCIIQSVELQAAPSVPTFLTENGLTYCTHASGFSFNPQTDVTRRLVESYFGKILDETAWVKDKNTH